MALSTGLPDGPPVATPGDLAACARGAIAALAALAASDRLTALDAASTPRRARRRPRTLASRARRPPAAIAACCARATAGSPSTCRAPRTSRPSRPGSSTRAPRREPPSLRARQTCGTIAPSPARRAARPLVARARVCSVSPRPRRRAAADRLPLRVASARANRVARRDGARASLVVDLSSLWAGPLATPPAAPRRCARRQGREHASAGRRAPRPGGVLRSPARRQGKRRARLHESRRTDARSSRWSRAPTSSSRAPGPRAMEQLGIDRGARSSGLIPDSPGSASPATAAAVPPRSGWRSATTPARAARLATATGAARGRATRRSSAPTRSPIR